MLIIGARGVFAHRTTLNLNSHPLMYFDKKGNRHETQASRDQANATYDTAEASTAQARIAKERAQTAEKEHDAATKSQERHARELLLVERERLGEQRRHQAELKKLEVLRLQMEQEEHKRNEDERQFHRDVEWLTHCQPLDRHAYILKRKRNGMIGTLAGAMRMTLMDEVAEVATSFNELSASIEYVAKTQPVWNEVKQKMKALESRASKAVTLSDREIGVLVLCIVGVLFFGIADLGLWLSGEWLGATLFFLVFLLSPTVAVSIWFRSKHVTGKRDLESAKAELQRYAQENAPFLADFEKRSAGISAQREAAVACYVETLRASWNTTDQFPVDRKGWQTLCDMMQTDYPPNLRIDWSAIPDEQIISSIKELMPLALEAAETMGHDTVNSLATNVKTHEPPPLP